MAKETRVSLLFPVRFGISSKMILVAVPIIGYYFGDGYRSRQTLRRSRKIPVTLSSQKVITVELSTIWHYLFIDAVIDLMSIEHLLCD